MTGLFGALIAWRISVADTAAGDASRAALAATRERARAVLTAEAEVTQSQAAWLSYELASRRADALIAAGQPTEGLRAAKEAASHWAFVRGEFMRADGTYDVAAHRRTTLAQIASGSDIDPARHLANASAAEGLESRLALAGILVAVAIPFLAAASVTRGRMRLAATLAGTVIFVVSGIALAFTLL
jgi:hypothetical protein